jgi:hypothetical protein
MKPGFATAPLTLGASCEAQNSADKDMAVDKNALSIVPPERQTAERRNEKLTRRSKAQHLL